MVKLINIYRNFNIKAEHKNSIVLIGNFDGLHLGHQKLFTLAKKYKKKYSLKVGVLTFEPMPKMYFNQSIKNFRISSQEQKIKLLRNLNVDFIIIKKFNKVFSKTKSINFKLSLKALTPGRLTWPVIARLDLKIKFDKNSTSKTSPDFK